VILDIVIVNWNSRSLLRECLAALDQSDIAECMNIVVVDNASTDSSVAGLAAQRAGLDLMLNAKNVGFAAACNQGAKRGSAPFLLFLNPDVQVKPNALATAVRYLNEPAHSDVGILGIQLLGMDGRVQRTCARAPTASALLLQSLFLDRLCSALVAPHFLTHWDHGDTRPVDQVMGAFLLIRRQLFERLGGFDERFFLYYEDVDLCLSAREAGCSVVYHAGAQAFHLGQGTTSAIKDRRLFYQASSRVQYTAKRYGQVTAIMLAGLILGIEMPVRWLHATLTRSPREGRLVARGILLFWRGMPGLLDRIRANTQ
jgi:N-acetylglucosaminyl-diphospho-decaprenol L-rhamnosyltransferase